MKIKEWYLENYPSDELGHAIDENATFEGLFEALDSYQDAYEYIGGKNSFHIDTVIRERCFEKLASIMRVPYSEVYSQWLMGSR